MKVSFTGGCMCGAVRYECTADRDRLQLFKCQCRDCQELSGGPFSDVIFLPAGALRFVRGKLKHYTTSSDLGGHNRRAFCPECGALLTGGEGAEGIGITAASLDDPAQLRPELESWLDRWWPWDSDRNDSGPFGTASPA